jgi:hypothetical protein
MKAISLITAVLAFGLSSEVFAQQAPERRLGEHPAVAVKRAEARQGYDYASKFYPHPAWLYLASEAPRPMMDHPAVIVARRHRQMQVQEHASLAQTTPVAQPTPLEASIR